MTWSYDTALTADKDKIRALIGDTDTNDQIISDEEIAFFLTQSGNIYGAAARTCRAIAAKFSRRTDIEVEGVSDKMSQLVKHYNALATSYDIDSGKFGSTINPVVTGISRSEMRTVRQNSDRVDPAFTMTQFDNRWVQYDGDDIDNY
jgi:hypothetical protein